MILLIIRGLVVFPCVLKEWVIQVCISNQLEGPEDSVFEFQEDISNVAQEIPRASMPPKGRKKAHGKKEGVKSTHNLRNKVVLEKLVNFKRKELVDLTKKAIGRITIKFHLEHISFQV